MKKILYSISLFCCLLQSSCHKEKLLQDVDYLIFGYYNFAWGPNCEVYKLTAEALYGRSSDCWPPPDTVAFSATPMSGAAFNLASDLISDIPESLYYGEQVYFEGEVCADCGGYVVEISKGGVVRHFSFGDIRSKNWPNEVKDFYEDFTAVISLLPQ